MMTVIPFRRKGVRRMDIKPSVNQAQSDEAEEEALMEESVFEKNTQLLTDLHQHQNRSAFDQLIHHNMGLVRKVARGYLHYVDHQLDFEDLVSEGVFGLMEAIHRFDLSRGVHFSTYAHWWIQQRILKGIINTGMTVRIPKHMFETVLKIRRAELPYVLNQKAVDAKAICEQLEIPFTTYEQAKMVEHQFLKITSLDPNPRDQKEAGTTHFVSNEALFAMGQWSKSFTNPAWQAEQNDRRRRLYDALSHYLNEREKEVLIARFGLHGDPPKTQKELGQIFGVTRERIHQIEKNALKKLRKALTCNGSRDDWL